MKKKRKTVYSKPKIVKRVEKDIKKFIKPQKPSSSELYMTTDTAIVGKLQNKFTINNITGDKKYIFNASETNWKMCLPSDPPARSPSRRSLRRNRPRRDRRRSPPRRRNPPASQRPRRARAGRPVVERRRLARRNARAPAGKARDDLDESSL